MRTMPCSSYQNKNRKEMILSMELPMNLWPEWILQDIRYPMFCSNILFYVVSQLLNNKIYEKNGAHFSSILVFYIAQYLSMVNFRVFACLNSQLGFWSSCNVLKGPNVTIAMSVKNESRRGIHLVSWWSTRYFHLEEA